VPVFFEERAEKGRIRDGGLTRLVPWTCLGRYLIEAMNVLKL